MAQGFQHLVGRHDIFKAQLRHSVDNTRIVRVKGEYIVHPHALKLLQSKRAIQTFTGGTPVLAAFVQKGHDNIDTFGLSADGGDDSL